MKKVLRLTLISAAVLAVPAAASEVGVMVDKQFGKAQTVAALGSKEYDAVSPTGFGIRGAYTVWNLKVMELGLTATYHSKAEGDVVFDGTKFGTFSNEYVAVGAQVDWKFLVNLHVGLDLRREKYTSDLLLVGKDSTTVTRPWLKAGFGFAIASPVITPFFRLEVAMATNRDDKVVDFPATDNTRKALAPECQIGLYGGIRF